MTMSRITGTMNRSRLAHRRGPTPKPNRLGPNHRFFSPCSMSTLASWCPRSYLWLRIESGRSLPKECLEVPDWLDVRVGTRSVTASRSPAVSCGSP